MADASGLEGRKTIFATLGGTLFVAGIALAGTAIDAIVDAPAKRNLTVEWILLGLAIAIMVGGLYVFVAAFSEHLWCPGMKRVRETARDCAYARSVLTQALGTGLDLTVQPHGQDEIPDWFNATLAFVQATWGETGRALIAGGARESLLDGTTEKERLHSVLSRIEAFLVRCSEVPLLPVSERTQLSSAQWKAMLGNSFLARPEGDERTTTTSSGHSG